MWIKVVDCGEIIPESGIFFVLTGTYKHNMDAKGRIFIPAKLRDRLGDCFLVTKGIGSCLFVFSDYEWNCFAEKLKIAPVTDVAAQSFLRMLFANACDCEPDKQGRILLPQNLRKHIHAEKELVVIGVGRRAEIWSAKDWDEYNEVTYKDYEETLAKLAELGI